MFDIESRSVRGLNRSLKFKVGLVGIVWMTSVAADAMQLITEEEARLPPPKGAIVADRRGVTRAPKVDATSTDGPVRSPMHLQLKFESFGGAKIDLEAVKFTYLRTPNVDLTPRLKALITSNGLDIPDAELPIGDHMIRVDIKDSDGRRGSTSFLLKVKP